MRVRIGNWWYAPTSSLPLMIELDEADKAKIAAAEKTQHPFGLYITKYAAFADDEPMDEEQRKKWMNK